MDLPKEIRKGEELDWALIETYLRDHLPLTEGAMEVAQFHGGHANLTYLIKFGATEYVFRRPPFGKIAPGAHDMKREYRVLSKLYQHYDPAPQAFHLCEDEELIGAKFVVMERRTGVVIRSEVLECFKPFENVENRLTVAMLKAQAQLHQLDIEACGLERLGKPEGFVKRQLKGWGQRWHLSKTEENPLMDQILEKLGAAIPQAQSASIIHNDIKFDNCQYQPDDPDQVTSIFDWDMTTLGDPLVDFGTTLSYWPDPYLAVFDLPVMLKGNFPSKDFVIQTYRELTGYDLSDLGWYEAFAYWKGAVVAQQLYQRYVKGDSHDERMAKFGLTASSFAQLAQIKLG